MYPFSREIALGSPLGHMTRLAIDSWPCYQCQLGVPYHGASLRPNQHVVGYSQNIRALHYHISGRSLSDPSLLCHTWIILTLRHHTLANGNHSTRNELPLLELLTNGLL